MTPLEDSQFGLLGARRALGKFLIASDLGLVAVSVAAALSLNILLLEALLLQWFQPIGGLLLAGQLSDERAWLVALKTITSTPRKFWAINRALSGQVHQRHGALVVQVSLPACSWSQHHDVSLEALCRRWLTQEGFYLFYSHGVQALWALAGGPGVGHPLRLDFARLLVAFASTIPHHRNRSSD